MKWTEIKWETQSWFLVEPSLNPILKPQIEKKKFNQQSFGVLGNKKSEIIICLDATLQPLSAFCFSSRIVVHDIGILPSNLFLKQLVLSYFIPNSVVWMKKKFNYDIVYFLFSGGSHFKVTKTRYFHRCSIYRDTNKKLIVAERSHESRKMV